MHILILQSFINLESQADSESFQGLPEDRNVRVYMDYPPFSQFLTDPRFELVSSESEADIIWVRNHWKSFQ